MEDATNLISNNKHFCILPWIHFHAWPDSRVLPCCVADSTKPVSHLKKDESIIQMLNSEEYKKMRLAMLNDEPYEACQRCYDLETFGNWTMRQSQNTVRGLNNKHLVEATNSDGSIDNFEMKYMDIRFSNICNMKCRSCGPSCSSLWAQETIDSQGMEHYEKHFGQKKFLISNNEDSTFINKLKPYLRHAEEVYFAGGEIIITPEHYECLDYWIENNLTEQVELTYTTNLGVLKYKDRDLINYWKQFPRLKIWASLDAGGNLAEVMRKGTDWDRIVKNIRTIQKELPHVQFQITPTISIWNVFTFPKFFDSLIEEGLISKDTSPRFNTLSSPWFANIMILPDHIKLKLVKLYTEYTNKYSYNQFISHGFQIIEYTLNSGRANHSNNFVSLQNKGGIKEFKEFNNRLDQIRNETITNIIPELVEVYEWAEN
jgi:Iron-sulfur cluster-binding domain